MTHKISYPVWKTAALAAGWSTYHVDSGTSQRKVFAGTAAHFFGSYAEGSDYTDWVTNFSGSSTEVVSESEAIAYLVGLDQAPNVPILDADQRTYVRNTYSSQGSTFQYRLFEFTPGYEGGIRDKYWSVTNSQETDWGEITCHVFDSSNYRDDDASFNTLLRVRTELDLDFPSADLIGAKLMLPGSLATGAWYLYTAAGPTALGDAYMKHMISGGANLQSLVGTTIDIDGKSSKHLEPDVPVTGAHKLRVVLIHPTIVGLPSLGTDKFIVAVRHYR